MALDGAGAVDAAEAGIVVGAEAVTHAAETAVAAKAASGTAVGVVACPAIR